jgi:hypothetical protein
MLAELSVVEQRYLAAREVLDSGAKIRPKPLSPRSRSRVGKWDTGAGAVVGQRCRTFTFTCGLALWGVSSSG